MNILALWIHKQIRDERLDRLRALSVDELKALWDQYDGINAPSGFEGEDIHLVLNQKGHGDYCAV